MDYRYSFSRKFKLMSTTPIIFLILVLEDSELGVFVGWGRDILMHFDNLYYFNQFKHSSFIA